MSSEISDLIVVGSLSKGTKFDDYFFDVYCVNEKFLVRCQIFTISHCTVNCNHCKKIGFNSNINLNPTHLPKTPNPKP